MLETWDLPMQFFSFQGPCSSSVSWALRVKGEGQRTSNHRLTEPCAASHAMNSAKKVLLGAESSQATILPDQSLRMRSRFLTKP